MALKLKSLNLKLAGTEVPDKEYGKAAKYVENLLKDRGVPMQNGPGPDILEYGIEVKQRDLGSTSPQTVATMSPDNIINTSYKDSVVFEKIQQQYRIKTENNTVVSDSLYDFSKPYIQDLIEEAYETGRQHIAEFYKSSYNSGGYAYSPDYIPGTQWGYFERTKKESNSYSFRISDGAFKKIETMSVSTFDTIFEYNE